MHPFLALFLIASCEACDELAKAGVAHPFAIGASWRPKCDAAAVRFVASDPWPAAGEVRRDRFTRDCADVSLTRVFVPASGGFVDGELFVGALIERKVGRGVTAIRQQEFLGAVGGYSYRYHLTVDGLKVLGSVETPKMTSHLVSTVLAPAVRATGGAVQSVSCEIWRGRCELLSRRVAGDAALPFFTVQFDKAHPDGELCIDPSEGVSVSVRADDVLVVDAAKAPAGAYNVCLGEGSRAALDAMGRARVVRYRVNRAAGEAATAWDVAELDATGLNEAVGLARFLLAQVVLADTRAVDAQKLKARAEVLLDGAAIPN